MILKKRRLKFSIILLSFINPLLSENFTFDKYDKMVNAFILGKDEVGLEIGLDLISENEYLHLREESLFKLAEYFFIKAIGKDEVFSYGAKSLTLYNMILTDYPNSIRTPTIEKRKFFLFNIFSTLQFTGDELNEFFNEAKSVLNLFEIGEIYETPKDEYHLSKWSLLQKTKQKFQVANKYFDTIILNHPSFEVYGYYSKLYLYLSRYDKWVTKEFLLETGLQEDSKEYTDEIHKDYWVIINKEVSTLLRKKMDKIYPNNSYTLDMHLMLALAYNNDSYFLGNNEEIQKKMVLKHLQYILDNDNDKVGLRYVLAKEFVIRNY